MSADLFQRLMGPDGMSMVNGTTGVHGEEYWTDGGTMSVSQVRPSSPQTQPHGQSQAQPQRQVSDVYSNTLPVRRPAPAKNKNPVGKYLIILLAVTHITLTSLVGFYGK